ncbi:MAG: hypothetical protein ACIARR_08390 [Phycisphaerales bacterium JB059]
MTRPVLRLAILLAFVLVRPALGERAPDAWALIDAMPAPARLVVVADNLSRTLASPEGDAVRRAVETSGFFGPTIAQWGELADRLGMTPSELTDALLGRRVVFLATELTSLIRPDLSGAGDWALILSIPPETEKLLRKRLDLAPRSKIGAFPIVAAEHGEYALALLSMKPADAGAPTTLLILTPSRHDALLEPVVRALTRPMGAPAPASAAPRPALRDDTALCMRLRTGEGATLTLAAHPSPGAWEAELSVEKPADAETAFGHRPVDRARFETLAPDALLLVMESVPDRLVPDRDRSLALSSTLVEIPERFLKLMGGRTIIRVRRAEPSARTLELTVASEATYPGDVVAEGDRAIGALLDPASSAVPPEGAIEGQYPSAVRTSTYTTDRATPFGERARAEWAYSAPDEGDPRWWAMRISSSTAPRDGSVRELADTLAGAPLPGGAHVLSMGLVRPRALRSVFREAPWASLPPIEAIAHVERVTWSIRRAPSREGRSHVTGSLRLSFAADAPPGPDP